MNNYVTISITGRNPKAYFKRTFKNIAYSNYKEINYKTIIVKINYIDYMLMNNKKSIYKINIIKYHGIIKYKENIKNNLLFFISSLIAFFILILISKLTFEIEVLHNDKNVRDLIKEELNDNNIKILSFNPSYNQIQKVKKIILEDNKDKIEWLEIEKTGSKLIVKVTERRSNIKEETINNRHIIAKKTGIILKIEAENGVILKKINDYVIKGDVLISGDIIKDETVKGQVPALGRVYAETWYKVMVEYPLFYEEIRYLDKEQNNYIIQIFNKKIALRKNYRSLKTEKVKVLAKNDAFPFSIYKEKQRKIENIKQKLTDEQAVKKAEEVAESKIKKKLSKDEYIISKNTLNFSIKDSIIIIDVFFKVYENITDYKPVDESLLNAPIIEE